MLFASFSVAYRTKRCIIRGNSDESGPWTFHACLICWWRQSETWNRISSRFPTWLFTRSHCQIRRAHPTRAIFVWSLTFPCFSYLAKNDDSACKYISHINTYTTDVVSVFTPARTFLSMSWYDFHYQRNKSDYSSVNRRWQSLLRSTPHSAFCKRIHF